MTEPVADWSAFPHGYSLLLNERAQFPVDLASWRLRIDGSRQLFVDDYLIARSTNLRRRLHPVAKHPANPLVRDLWAVHVHPEPGGGYRLYGNGWRGRLDGRFESDAGKAPRLYLGRSADGVEWNIESDPLLGRMDVTAAWAPLQGQPHGVLFEPEAAVDARWKLVLCDRGRQRRAEEDTPFAGATLSIALYTSPDGERWTWKADTTLLRKGTARFSRATPGEPYPEGLGDVLQVRHDPVLGRYVAHTKHAVVPDPRFRMITHGADGPRGTYEARAAGWSESDDLIHWSAPRLYAYPDGEDARVPGMYGIYEADGFPYESLWLGCLSMSANVPDPDCTATPRHAGGYKRNWIRLAGSRDGRHWYYLADREAFIPNGGRDDWDAHYIRMAQRVTTAGPVAGGDEVWFYYGGQYGGIPDCQGLTLPKSDWQAGLGLGVARRDGFVSLEAGDEPGEVITRPLVFDGDTLCVNAQAGVGGSLRVAVLEEDGTSIAGFGPQDCAAVEGDVLRAAVGWSGDPSLASLQGRYVRLAFTLQRARLFSFWVE